MKRRVVRAHANKRNLRLISATHALLPGSYNVLCDASFLRAALLSYAQQHLPKMQGSRKGKKNKDKQQQQQQNEVEQDSATSKPSPMQFLRGIVEEAFGALESSAAEEEHQQQQQRQVHRRMPHRYMAYASHKLLQQQQQQKKRKPKPLQIRYSCLPATVTTLQRLIAQHNEAMAHYKPTYPPQPSHKQVVRKLVPKAVVDDLLAHIRVIRGLPDRSASLTQSTQAKEPTSSASKTVPAVAGEYERNEVKAIEDFMAHCKARREAKQRKGTEAAHEAAATSAADAALCKALPDNVPNAFHFFIATQSHDVRKHLPSNTALLRWATLPDCAYIELLDATYNYSSAGNAHAAGTTGTPSSSTLRQQTPAFSKADLAFMQSIGKLPHSLQQKAHVAAAAAQQTQTPSAHASSTAATSKLDTSAAASTAGNNVSAQNSIVSKAKKRHRTHQPNPLSVKKKQKREVFRITST